MDSAVRTPGCSHPGLGSSGFARRYSRNRFFFLFLRLLRCFSSPGSPPQPIRLSLIQLRIHGVFPCGFPHSDIRGSLDICSSPRLFAAYHVFRRLSVPRHPPCALSCLTSPHSAYSVTRVLLFLIALFLFSDVFSVMASRHDWIFSILSIRFSRYVLRLKYSLNLNQWA